MSVGEWKLVPYNCQDGECLMIWHTGRDHKLGALSPSHRSIGEAIVEELNRLENKNAEINYYIETVEEANDTLKTIRDNLKKENNQLKKENSALKNQVYKSMKFDWDAKEALTERFGD